MEGGFNKAGSPEASGEGSRRAPAGAYYECSFCKRGFTNAQALGGHMNIHRKDRSGGKSGTAPPDAPGWQQDDSGGARTYGRDVHLGLSLGRNEDSRAGVDLELRLGSYPYN
ncbi:probable transcriptional regulator RABBIT EARS [Phragmites australis]|uniref:probable transcriptional regulator RABBIT EARS n=1 Tax=Phragmites australis TaxID=29695 RepID=UPI002D78DCFE|nr:probable transcriptional regulator RABBIT EARS [Phragmites australis]